MRRLPRDNDIADTMPLLTALYAAGVAMARRRRPPPTSDMPAFAWQRRA